MSRIYKGNKSSTGRSITGFSFSFILPLLDSDHAWDLDPEVDFSDCHCRHERPSSSTGRSREPVDSVPLDKTISHQYRSWISPQRLTQSCRAATRSAALLDSLLRCRVEVRARHVRVRSREDDLLHVGQLGEWQVELAGRQLLVVTFAATLDECLVLLPMVVARRAQEVRVESAAAAFCEAGDATR